MDNNTNGVEKTLCEYVHMGKMFDQNITTLDSFELKTLGWLKSTVKQIMSENKMSKHKVQTLYKEYIKTISK